MPSEYKEISVNNTDIFQHPQLITNAPCDPNAQITVGDLHGNAMKLMYILVRHGITDISDMDYKELVRIYKTDPEQMTKKDLESFDAILNKIKFKSEGTLRLIGDELADRGQNDYFTLKILEKLDKSNVNVEILFSNHGVEFIENYEANRNYEQTNLSYGQARSMQNMQKLLDRKLITHSEIGRIVENTYKKSLKAISYTLNDAKDKITIYSHAPIDLTTIENTAKKVGVLYDVTTAIGLAKTIDAINEKFQERLHQNQVHDLYPRLDQKNTSSPTQSDPFIYMIWSRDHTILRPEKLSGGNHVDFTHGHDSSSKTHDNINNLDNDFGKTEDRRPTTYSYTYSHGTQLKEQLVASVAPVSAQATIDKPAAANLAPQRPAIKIEEGLFEDGCYPPVPAELLVEPPAQSNTLTYYKNLFETSGLSTCMEELSTLITNNELSKREKQIAKDLHTQLERACSSYSTHENPEQFIEEVTGSIERAQNKGLGQTSKMASFLNKLVNAVIAVSTLGVSYFVTGKFDLVQVAKPSAAAETTTHFKDSLNRLIPKNNGNESNDTDERSVTP